MGVRGAANIGLTMAIFGIFSILSNIWTFFNFNGFNPYLAGNVISSITFTVMYFLVWFGARKNKKNYLLPCIIIQGISLFVCLLMSVLLLFLAGILSGPEGGFLEKLKRNMEISQEQVFLIIVLTIIFIFIPIFSMMTYFWYVIWNAYRVLKVEQNLRIRDSIQPIPMQTRGKM